MITTPKSLDERAKIFIDLSNSPKRGSDHNDPLRQLDFHTWPVDIESLICDLAEDRQRLMDALSRCHEIMRTCLKDNSVEILNSMSEILNPKGDKK